MRTTHTMGWTLLTLSLAANWGCKQAEAPDSDGSQTDPPANPKAEVTPKPEVKPENPKHKFTNRLAKEKSPYLQQHKHNPVDWYPWGKEAFDKAKKENKPVFLSIGYSTCHWCHVMERESFESEEVAEILNEFFICVKLDREERPDIDKIYMTYVQASTGGGGWPMSVWMTPEQKPFLGGTYFPKDRFMSISKQLGEFWQDEEKGPEIRSAADNIHEQLYGSLMKEPSTDGKLHRGMITNTVETIQNTYDPRFGGFGREPKFPRPSEPSLVLWQAARSGNTNALGMVTHTCDRMAAGGIYDHLGGGFARYSVDAEWLVPHFEKMLYDNAQLIHLYLDTYLVTREQKYADTVRDILRYIDRDMTHKDGGWYSAEDADSEGHEGKFYCWTKKQLEELLTESEAKVVIRYYGITEEGNFEDHSHPEPLKKQNVLSIVDPKLSDDEKGLLASAINKMNTERDKRVRPGLDDKILSSWNGLMLGAVARAHAVLGDEAYLKAAEANFQFIQKELWDPKTKTMYHRWRDGERDSVQLLDAYSFQLDGTLHLYEATLQAKYLEQAIALADRMIELFHDDKNGAFWQGTGDTGLITRMKEDYDGAIPSANSVGALALLKLYKITENKMYRDKARGVLQLFADRLEKSGIAVPYLVQALDFYLHEPYRVVIAGDPKDPAFKAVLHAAHQEYQPNRVLIGNHGPVEPFAKKDSPPAGNGGPMVYVCTGSACKIPTDDPKEFRKYLSDAPPLSKELPAEPDSESPEPEGAEEDNGESPKE